MATKAQQGEIEVEEESQVTRPSDLGFPENPQNTRTPEGIPIHREIEVEALESAPVNPNDTTVEVRMAETIEEFTYGNPHQSYRLESGKRYRLPVEVARYLNALGYIYHRGG